MERSICDILIIGNRMDNQIFSNTLKRAAKKKHLDYTLLIEYEKNLM